jgi:hypothetical protein
MFIPFCLCCNGSTQIMYFDFLHFNKFLSFIKVKKKKKKLNEKYINNYIIIYTKINMYQIIYTKKYLHF